MFGFIFATIIDLIAIAFNGLILSVMWKWFVVPVFHLPVLTVPQAIGIVLVTSLLTLRKTANEFDKDVSSKEVLLSELSNNFIHPISLLFLGWLFHQFIF